LALASGADRLPLDRWRALQPERAPRRQARRRRPCDLRRSRLRNRQPDRVQRRRRGGPTISAGKEARGCLLCVHPGSTGGEVIMLNEYKLKEQICEIGRRVYARGFAAANDGNISIRLNDREVLCTPTMMCKGFMKCEDMCVVDYEGKQVRGTRKRSS